MQEIEGEEAAAYTEMEPSPQKSRLPEFEPIQSQLFSEQTDVKGVSFGRKRPPFDPGRKEDVKNVEEAL